ncbi:DNA (cytosine-5-)-methyltransferase [Maricaulis sp.]|uniref:DNA (cytosine-5-)-methyltransferase n=1 Tax=Maricaulis sp. TaxID=1486257 RepID=UPI002B27082F|nr:DNA (cytosine-5-)-methyltransferase [Maricaulis sp.]
MTSTQFRECREKAGMSVEATASHFNVTPKTVYRWESGEVAPNPIFVKELQSMFVREDRGPDDFDFRFIDLFAGIGGIRRGFNAAGGKCVFTSEWDTYAQKTYKANYPDDDHEIRGDITEIEADEIPDHDVLLAGFPCQPFSIAGVSKKNSLGRQHGFMDKAQGTLFFDVLRILKAKRPAAFLLENVKNLKSHNRGDTFATIKGALENDLGYHVSTVVIDAKGYVPQHRERIFIVGFREECRFDISKLSFRDPKTGPRLDSILHSPDETPEEQFTLPVEEAGANEASFVNPKYTLSDKLWNYLQGYAEKHRAKGNGFGFGLCGPEDTARTLSARYYKDGSEILIAQEGRNPRRLTPRECARLMGFDQPGHPPMKIPVSDTRAYKQFGNAVAVPVIEDIAIKMKPFIMAAIMDQSDAGPLFADADAAE